jgi:hypothetical protein
VRVLQSIPVSKFVALSFMPSSPATMTMPDRTGNVVERLSAKRDTLFTASANSFLSTDIIMEILILLGLWTSGKVSFMYYIRFEMNS